MDILSEHGHMLWMTQTWTRGHTRRHTRVHTHLPCHICFTWTANRAEEYFEVCPSSGFKPTITCCTLGMFFKCRFGVQSRPSWIGLWCDAQEYVCMTDGKLVMTISTRMTDGKLVMTISTPNKRPHDFGEWGPVLVCLCFCNKVSQTRGFKQQTFIVS